MKDVGEENLQFVLALALPSRNWEKHNLTTTTKVHKPGETYFYRSVKVNLEDCSEAYVEAVEKATGKSDLKRMGQGWNSGPNPPKAGRTSQRRRSASDEFRDAGSGGSSPAASRTSTPDRCDPPRAASGPSTASSLPSIEELDERLQNTRAKTMLPPCNTQPTIHPPSSTESSFPRSNQGWPGKHPASEVME